MKKHFNIIIAGAGGIAEMSKIELTFFFRNIFFKRQRYRETKINSI